MGKEAKTNAMRILEREKVAYTAHEYPHEEGVAVDGVTVAASIGEDPACVYKTLVTQGSSKNYFVFVIPVAAELDLKAAARSVGEKSVAMIHVADINMSYGTKYREIFNFQFSILNSHILFPRSHRPAKRAIRRPI